MGLYLEWIIIIIKVVNWCLILNFNNQIILIAIAFYKYPIMEIFS